MRYAYEVLYDPVLRKVYDDGNYHALDHSQISTELVHEKKAIQKSMKKGFVNTNTSGTFSLSVDVSSLMEHRRYSAVEYTEVSCDISYPVSSLGSLLLE